MSSIQFGVMVVLNLMIGTVTPPIGAVLFGVSTGAKISFEQGTKATLPFMLPLLAVLTAGTLWPQVLCGRRARPGVPITSWV